MNPAMSMNKLGIQSLGPMLASMGSYEDKDIAHVAKGEVVVPKQLMDTNPELRSAVMSAFDEVGVDPAQFVVGGDVVMRNPITGIQEFGLFKKLKKLVKKLTPVLVPLAVNFLAPGLGSVALGAISGGVTQALDGANLRDVLKGAAGGGAIGGIAQFASNLGTGQTGGYFKAPTPTTAQMQAGQKAAAEAGAEAQKLQLASGSQTTPTANQAAGQRISEKLAAGENGITIAGSPASQTSAAVREAQRKALRDQGIISLSDGTQVAQNALVRGASKAADLAGAYGKKLAKPFMPKTFNPLTAAGYYQVADAILSPEEAVESGMSEQEYNDYMQKYYDSFPAYSSISINYGQSPAASGMRAGGAVNGPGTGTSDSIPAMLSDGEFVMTAKAVRGAGDGDRKAGAAKMYAMMDQFEGKA